MRRVVGPQSKRIAIGANRGRSSKLPRPSSHTLDVDVLVVTKESELTRLAKSLTDEDIKAGTRELSHAWRSRYRIATVLDSKSPYRLDIIFTDQGLEREAGSILGAHT